MDRSTLPAPVRLCAAQVACVPQSVHWLPSAFHRVPCLMLRSDPACSSVLLHDSVYWNVFPPFGISRRLIYGLCVCRGSFHCYTHGCCVAGCALLAAVVVVVIHISRRVCVARMCVCVCLRTRLMYECERSKFDGPACRPNQNMNGPNAV